jgi:hypothetical protein
MSETWARGILSSASSAATWFTEGVKNKFSNAATRTKKVASEAVAALENSIIQNALRALLHDESNIIIKLLEGQEINKEDYQEDQLYIRTTNIINSISTFLITYSFLAEMIINNLVEQYGLTIYNAIGTRNIILQLSEIDTVKLNNKDGFLTKIENYLYTQNDRKLSANDKTNMIKILQLIIDILKILLAVEPFPFLNESGDKKPGTIALKLLISVLTEILGKSKNSFNVKRDEEDVTYKWNEDTNSFTPYTDPFASNCHKVVVMRDVGTEADSNKTLNVMVFLIVLLKNLVKKLVKLKRDQPRIRSSTDDLNSELRGGRNKKYRKTKKTKKTKKIRKTKSTR